MEAASHNSSAQKYTTMLTRTSVALARAIVSGQRRMPLPFQLQRLGAGLPQTRALPVSVGMHWFSTSSSDSSGQAGAQEAKANEAGEAGEGRSETDKMIDKLEADLKQMQQEVADMKGKALRAYADAENTRVIAKRDVENAKAYAIQSFAKNLLDVADNLNRAIEAVPADARENKQDNAQLVALLEGVEMTSKQLSKVFGEFGIAKFGEVGEKFDPTLHEAMFEYEDATKEPLTIGQIMKCGYKLKDRVIRAAHVGTIRAST